MSRPLSTYFAESSSSEPRLLYHYSDKRYDELLTLSLQQKKTSDSMKRVGGDHSVRSAIGPYNESISFFITELPMKGHSTRYNGKHPFWKKGAKLYKYAVNVDDLPIYGWKAVEQLWSSKLFVAMITKYDGGWENVPEFEQDSFIKLLEDNPTRINVEKGVGKDSLTKLYEFLDNFQSKDILAGFELLRKHGTPRNFLQYAAYVPHLMLYTEKPIKVHSVETVIVG